MPKESNQLSTSTCPPHHDTLVLLALRWIAHSHTRQLPLSFAIDAAMVAVHMATEGGDALALCVELTGWWYVGDEEGDLIERLAARLRIVIAGDTVADGAPECVKAESSDRPRG